PGATAASFVPTADLVNTLIRVKVTGTKPGFVSTSEMSLQAKVVTLATITQTFKPVIRGDLEVGKNLVADATGWPSDITLDYAWYIGNDYQGSGPTYTLQQWNLDRPLKVIVYASKSGYKTVGVASDPVNPVAKDFEQSNVPVITGATSIGHYLTAEIGDWPSGTSISYQWYLDGNPIGGEYQSQYMVRESDLNHNVTVSVSASKVGFRDVTVTSEPRKITWGIFSATNSPSISGSAKVGQTLTVTQAATDPYAEISYQWLRDGSYIWGQTGSTYYVNQWDYGHRISVISNWSSTGFQTSVATSSEVQIGLGDLARSGSVQITGNPFIGNTIYASVGSWQSGTSISYRWFKDGAVIPNATNYYLNLAKGDYGHSFTLEVTGSQYNYNNTVVVSEAVLVGLNPYSYGVDLSGLDFSNQTLTGYNFNYANLTNAIFKDSNLTGSSFYGANLSGTNFQAATMASVSSGSISGQPSKLPTGWKFSNGYLIGSGANLSSANLYSLSLDHMDLTGTNLSYANLNYANLSFTNLSGATLTGAYMNYAVLGMVRSGNILGVPNNMPSGWNTYSGYLIGPGTDLAGVNLSGQSMVSFNLRSANLVGTNLSNTDLSFADLTAANLNGANLSSTKLISAVLLGADLTNANLSSAKLSNANLQTSVLIGANIAGANLALANLLGAQLDGVTGDNVVGPATNYPEGWQITGGKLLRTQVNKGAASLVANPQVGQVLTPTTGSWDDGVMLDYKWLQDGVEIAGAT
ncbi:MAG: pentapeptide repeat-containing protein, partial [Microbacteriaceae bacterium]|nr:pentapeptide repeat-containing protein [Microbacteriaceae bacterium]